MLVSLVLACACTQEAPESIANEDEKSLFASAPGEETGDEDGNKTEDETEGEDLAVPLEERLRVNTEEATAVGTQNATLHGSASIVESPQIDVAYFYYSDTEETVEGLLSRGTRVEATTLGKDGSFEVALQGLSPATTYHYVAVATIRTYCHPSDFLPAFTRMTIAIITRHGEVRTFTTDAAHTPGDGIPEGAVDLGMVMTRPDGTTYKLYWASSNLCEDGLCPNPEDYGDYYAWGELEPYYEKGHSQDDPCTRWRKGKSGYDWNSYKWCNGDYDELTRYGFKHGAFYYWGGPGTPDNKKNFSDYDYIDDAARAVLGGKWRIPSSSELTALRTTCIWEWVDNYHGTGIKGRLVTASNGNCIFLPAAGERENIGLTRVGDSGEYWASSVLSAPWRAVDLYFRNNGVYQDVYGFRKCGFSIRPVTE